jgi:hypothetical protein
MDGIVNMMSSGGDINVSLKRSDDGEMIVNDLRG